MENQHQKITGYRELEQSEIDAMNELKAQEKKLLGYLRDLSRVVAPQVPEDSEGRGIPVMLYDQRWLAIARTHIQEGISAARRAVARPDE